MINKTIVIIGSVEMRLSMFVGTMLIVRPARPNMDIRLLTERQICRALLEDKTFLGTKLR